MFCSSCSYFLKTCRLFHLVWNRDDQHGLNAVSRLGKINVLRRYTVVVELRAGAKFGAECLEQAPASLDPPGASCLENKEYTLTERMREEVSPLPPQSVSDFQAALGLFSTSLETPVGDRLQSLRVNMP